jgi:hypothetical protein
MEICERGGYWIGARGKGMKYLYLKGKIAKVHIRAMVKVTSESATIS